MVSKLASNHRLSPLCVGSSLKSGKAEDLSQYDPGCLTGPKTSNFRLL